METVFSLLGGVGIVLMAIFVILYCYWLYRLIDLLVTKTRIVDMRLKELLEELKEMRIFKDET